MGEHFAPSPQGKSGSSRGNTDSSEATAKAASASGAKGGERAQGRAAKGSPGDSGKGTRKDRRDRSQRNSPSANSGNNKRHSNGKASRGGGPNLSGGMTPQGWLGKAAFAALDLGTNNCRLLIARSAQEGFVVVDAFSRVVRLGEGLATSGKMSDDAMDRAVEALRICADKLKKRNVVLAHSVATEACRRADNGLQFIERVRRETGIHLNVISAEEEARLAVNGCYSLLEEGEGPALIFDIGGGSTELVLVATGKDQPKILDWVSVPWGVVSLSESMPFDYTSTQTRLASYDAMCAVVRDSFAEFVARLPAECGDRRMMGTSGTVTTLSSVYLKLSSYDRRKVDGLRVGTAEMRGIARELAACSLDERAAYPTIGRDRADLVVAGCAILEAIFDIWPGEQLGVADRGIREGLLRNLMAQSRRSRRNG